jgi:hypothetical protein
MKVHQFFPEPLKFFDQNKSRLTMMRLHHIDSCNSVGQQKSDIIQNMGIKDGQFT